MGFTGKAFTAATYRKTGNHIGARLKYGYKIFIETGTYLGDMVAAQINNFEKIYSIELGNELYDNAVKKFEHNKNVILLHGDSSEVFVVLLPGLICLLFFGWMALLRRIYSKRKP